MNPTRKQNKRYVRAMQQGATIQSMTEEGGSTVSYMRMDGILHVSTNVSTHIQMASGYMRRAQRDKARFHGPRSQCERCRRLFHYKRLRMLVFSAVRGHRYVCEKCHPKVVKMRMRAENGTLFRDRTGCGHDWKTMYGTYIYECNKCGYFTTHQLNLFSQKFGYPILTDNPYMGRDRRNLLLDNLQLEEG